jgi:hypothetical protein
LDVYCQFYSRVRSSKSFSDSRSIAKVFSILPLLASPAQRSQFRYFNVERLTEWASNLLKASTETMMILMPDFDESLIIEKMIEKLEWLAEYELEIIKWNQMLY